MARTRFSFESLYERDHCLIATSKTLLQRVLLFWYRRWTDIWSPQENLLQCVRVCGDWVSADTASCKSERMTPLNLNDPTSQSECKASEDFVPFTFNLLLRVLISVKCPHVFVEVKLILIFRIRYWWLFELGSLVEIYNFFLFNDVNIDRNTQH